MMEQIQPIRPDRSIQEVELTKKIINQESELEL